MQSAHFDTLEQRRVPSTDLSSLVTVRPRGVRVHALGSLRVSLGRLPLHALGGPKAGGHQARGLFGFLFDRGPQGIEKDEATEFIWPDLSIGAADTAFHRTLLGLRHVLNGGGFGESISFHSGRYVLASGLVSWSDTWEVERLIEASGATHEPRSRLELLEQARSLNQAEYMDDCPFFGASVFVEPRRAMWRAVRREVLLELADLYAGAGHHALGAIRRSEAELLAA